MTYSYADTAFHYKFRAFSLLGKEQKDLLQEDDIVGLALEVARQELVGKSNNDRDLLRVMAELSGEEEE